MLHRREMDNILSQVTPWPVEERMALASEILNNMRKQKRQHAPRNTADRTLGIAAGGGTAPDDAMVRQWVEEHRMQKHG